MKRFLAALLLALSAIVAQGQLYSVMTDANGVIKVPTNAAFIGPITAGSLTETQRDALSATNGMVLYNTTANRLERYEAGTWTAFPSGAGEANTASNQGGAVGLWKQKTGVDLEFYTLSSTHFVRSGDIISLSPTNLTDLVSLVLTNGNILYHNGTNIVALSPGSNGEVLTLSSGIPSWQAAGAGTVTSVGLSAPAIFSVSGSPVTSSGTLALSLANQSANTVWAGPSSGGATTPTFRALVADDIPALSYLSSTANVSDLNDVTITSIASGELLKWNGSAWINNTLAEAGIAATSHSHATTDITSGTFADARIAESNVTQHQAALTITESQISDLSHTDADAIHDNVSGEIAVITEKASPVSGDWLLIEDSAASNAKKRVQIGNLPSGGSSLPVDDTTSIAQDPVDGTKEMRIDVGAVATATVRVLTMPDRDVDLTSGGTFAENTHTHTESDISDLGNYVALDASLDAATGNETAFSIAYTVNKATSGNDTGILVNKTDTASPGSSLLLDLQTGGSTQFNVNDAGAVTAQGVIDGVGGLLASGGNITADTGNIVASNGNISADVGDISADSGTVSANAFVYGGGSGNGVLVTDGSNNVVEDSSVDTTELGYLNGVTSAIQTQLDAKRAKAGVDHVRINAGAFKANTTEPATADDTETTTNKVNYDGWSFANGETNRITASFMFPTTWNLSTVTYKIDWTTTATSGDAEWSVRMMSLADNDPEDTAYGTAVTVTDTANATASDRNRTAESAALTVGNTPADFDTIIIEVSRQDDGSPDTLAAAAVFRAITIEFTTDDDPAAF